MSQQVVRVLGRLRLSREQDGSTSIARQESYVQTWVEEEQTRTGIPHVIVGWAVDIDVSGSVDPFKTPEFGKWLVENPPEEWDVCAAWKIDRYSRRVVHSYKLLSWCKERGKRIKATNDMIDPDSRVGELLWFIISWLAEGELEAIKDRTSGTRAWLVKTDRFPGGSIPYGYVQTEHPSGEGYTLVLDVAMSNIINTMIDWIVNDGKSRSAVAKTLNEMGVPGPYKGRGYKPRGKAPSSLNGDWSATAVNRILRSKNLLGIRTHNGEVVFHEATGLPVQFGEPIISHSAFVDLQEALERTVRPRTKQAKEYTNSAPEIAQCAVCGRRMYRHTSGKAGKRREYFVCSGRRGTHALTTNPCGNRLVAKEEVWTHLETYLLDEIGDKPWQEKVIEEGQNHAEEIEQAKASMALLVERMPTLGAGAMEVFSNQITALDTKIRKLSELPVTERAVTWKPTGKTFREHWETLTMDQRVAMLNKQESYVSVLRWPGELTSPVLRPDLPEINFGGIRYALIPGKDRSHTKAQQHVVLGGDLQRMLRAT